MRHFLFFVLVFMNACSSLGELTKKQKIKADIFYDNGNHFLNSGRLDLAIQEYRKASLITPRDGRIYGGWGLVYMLNGKYGDALIMFKKSLVLQPTPEVYNNQAGVLNQLSRWDEAIESCENGLKYANYRTPETLYYQMGIAYLSKKNFTEALSYFSRIVDINSSIPEGHYFKGQSLSRLNRSREAIVEYEEALKLSLKFKNRESFRNALHRTVGLLYYGIGNKVDALRHLEEAYKGAKSKQDRIDIKEYLELLK